MNITFYLITLLIKQLGAIPTNYFRTKNHTALSQSMILEDYFMFKTDVQTKIEKLEADLTKEQENYVAAIRTRQNHNILRAFRDKIHKIKEDLSILYRSTDSTS